MRELVLTTLASAIPKISLGPQNLQEAQLPQRQTVTDRATCYVSKFILFHEVTSPQ